MTAAYRRSAVFAMPGVAELQSLVTLEALAAGRPVVAADAMALPHLVHPGRNGFLHRPGDTAGLADNLARLLTDRDLRRRMGNASRQLARLHDLSGTVRTFEDVYDRIVRRTTARPVAAAA